MTHSPTIFYDETRGPSISQSLVQVTDDSAQTRTSSIGEVEIVTTTKTQNKSMDITLLFILNEKLKYPSIDTINE
ncbi:2-oxoglutarate synthase subunit KorA [Dirofilaria immitis]